MCLVNVYRCKVQRCSGRARGRCEERAAENWNEESERSFPESIIVVSDIVLR